MRTRLVLLTTRLAALTAARWHVRTDPSCRTYKPARPGSRLDRASRGLSCRRCRYWRQRAAFAGLIDRPDLIPPDAPAPTLARPFVTSGVIPLDDTEFHA